MNLREVLYYVAGFVVCMSIQLLLLRNVALLGYGFCFLYIGAILVLPPETDKTLYLLIAFAAGILVDTFMNTLGLHAGATVLVAYSRSFWFRYQVLAKGEEVTTLTLHRMGFVRFVQFIFPLILLHHSALFLIEMNSFTLLAQTAVRILASTGLTTFTVLLWQSFHRR